MKKAPTQYPCLVFISVLLTAALIFGHAVEGRLLPGVKHSRQQQLPAGPSQEGERQTIQERGQGAKRPSNPTTEPRVALVIGNGAYRDAPLLNPVNDANDMAATLQELGFTVLKATDATLQQMEKLIREFGQRLPGSSVALFFFAGHGVQAEGENYLIPVDADIAKQEEVKYKAVNAGLVLAQMDNDPKRANIVILDACRNNPFRSFRGINGDIDPQTAAKLRRIYGVDALIFGSVDDYIILGARDNRHGAKSSPCSFASAIAIRMTSTSMNWRKSRKATPARRSRRQSKPDFYSRLWIVNAKYQRRTSPDAPVGFNPQA